MKRFLAGVISVLTAGACVDRIQQPDMAPAFVALALVPETIFASVGQTIQFVAVVSGTTDQRTFYTSSNGSIASVTSTGIAMCLAEGTAVITATSSVDPTARDVSVLTCTAAVILIQVDRTTLAFVHKVGTDPCAQTIGTVLVTNTSAQAISIGLTGHSALSVDASSFALAPGASRSITVSFNCSTQTSFVGTMTITATGGSGATEVKGVQVTGTIT